MDKRTSLVCQGTLSNKFVLKANYVRNTAYTKLCNILIESLDVNFLQHNFCIVDTEKLLNNVSFDELLPESKRYKNYKLTSIFFIIGIIFMCINLFLF